MRWVWIIAMVVATSLSTPTAQAQAPDPAAATAASRRAVGELAGDEAAWLRARRARDQLAAKYDRELREIDGLKRQRSSWRRDRQLKAALAASLETAKRLDAATGELTARQARVIASRRAALRALDAELGVEVAEARRAELVETRRRVRAALGDERRKRIVLPDEVIDPLADPEELDQQAAAAKQSEAELVREAENLHRQIGRFKRLAELRKQHDRADEIARLDDQGPRRDGTSGRRNEGALGADNDQSSPTTDPLSPPPTTDSPAEGPASGLGADGRYEGEPAVVLSGVIDASSVDALRRAERSTDPAAKAAAAEKAHQALIERLRRLKAHRAALEARANQLRK